MVSVTGVLSICLPVGGIFCKVPDRVSGDMDINCLHAYQYGALARIYFWLTPMSNLTCHHEGAKALSSSGSQVCSTDWNTPCVQSAQSLVCPGKALWFSLDSGFPCHLNDQLCWRTVVTMKLYIASPCGVSIDAWKNQWQSKAIAL